MPETKASAYTAEVFTKAMSAIIATKKTHDWLFYVSDEWELSSGSRDIIEDFARTMRTAQGAVSVMQKPHHWIEEIVAYVEDMSTVDFEKSAIIAKFGTWHCSNCELETTLREDGEHEDCE